MKNLSPKGRGKERPKQKSARIKPSAEAIQGEEIRERPSGQEPERIAEAYEQGIRDYEAYDQQQRYGSWGWFSYGSPYDPQGYGGTSSQDPMATGCGAFAEYEMNLQSLEQAQPDMDAIGQTIQPLQGKDREQSLKEWKEYLKSLLEAGKQLTDSIEASIQSLSPQSKG